MRITTKVLLMVVTSIVVIMGVLELAQRGENGTDQYQRKLMRS